MGSSSSSNGSKFKSWFSGGQNVWSGQEGPLKSLYADAANLFSQFNPSIFNNAIDYYGNYNSGLANDALPAWQQQLLGGSTTGTSNAINSDLIDSLKNSLSSPSNTGQMYQNIVGGSGNTYIDPMVDAMKRGTIDSLNRQLPTIDSNAINAGQMGSSRHGIAEGLARSDANKYMTDTEAMMRGQAYDTDLNWKMDIAKLADQNIGATQDRALNMLNLENAAQQNAINSGQNMSNYGAALYDAEVLRAQLPWDMMANYANILGSPTVLSNVSGGSKGSGSGSSKGGSLK